MKKFTTHEYKLKILKQRGLVIDDENRAIEILKRITYYILQIDKWL